MLDNKVIVITGGAGLLGRNFCRAVAAQGGIAIVADVNLPAAEDVAGKVAAEYPGRAEAAHLDITDKASVDGLIEMLNGKYGRIDAVVNNAYPRNANFGRQFEDIEYADFCENLNLHLAGYFLVAQRFSRYFAAHGGGNIVNMASVYGVIAPRFDIYKGTAMTNSVEYAAIKSGILHFSRYLAQYLKGKGIRVNCLSPGGILDRQPESFLEAYQSYCNEKGMLDPQDVSNTLVFLLSDASRYITGQNLIVDDGFAL
ncbi:MAG TPA: oxidoreductase [Methylophilaceae bacterium]|nr:oxidoreductase [Methylophilaceae bacterium]